jgi:formylglycine-generating enzyme required for sulfatase activity
MEYIDGQTLDDKLARSPESKLNFDETMAIVEKVALALDYAHSRKNPVFHLDLKPSNIMINSNGEIKLLDFGIAREMHDSYTRVTGKQDTSGTLPYMSPDQLQGNIPSAAMDIYALGAVCYECLSGHPPFYTGELTYQIFNKEPASVEGIAENINNVLKLALAKNCLNRPKTAKNLIELLKGKPQCAKVTIVKDNNEKKTNQEKRIKEAIKTGRPFGFVEKLAIDSFTCSFCGGDIDKSAIVLEDKNGNEILVGETCAERAGIKIQKSETETEYVLKPHSYDISEKSKVWPITVFPFTAVKAREYQKKTSKALNVSVEKVIYLDGHVKMKFALIPAGEFYMGSPANEEERLEDEGPVHKVKISKPFFMSKFPVTQEQYEIITGNNPSDLISPNLPVESVLWEEAVEFCTKLSHRKGKLFRLPTEAEWEYACRAGTTTQFNTGETISTDHANYNGNYIYGNGHIGVYRKKAIDVGSLIPNAFGLYDMHGNVWEWCSDWYDVNYYTSSPIIDPQGPSSGICRVLRGGTWSMYPSVCRSARRHRFSPDGRYSLYGFRVVMTIH